jgi:aspartate aminotransferase
MIDVSTFFPSTAEQPAAEAASLSQVALGMRASSILTIAYSVREAIARGATVAQFTVGDFAPGEFAVPKPLANALCAAVEEGLTNYPPAHGMAELRTAIQANYARDLGLNYPLDSIVVGSGARPGLYSIYRCLVDPGEVVLTPAPAWNNDNFCQLVGAEHRVVHSRREDAFMPTAERLAPHLKDARLLVLCSPMNPCGTLIRAQQLADICDLILAENARREAAGERLLYVVYDQVYRMLAFGAQQHHTPPGVRPEMARYTIFCDAISKCFAATGLRVGWLVAPPFIAAKVKALTTHVGAWAPKPEQLATAKLLSDDAAVEAYLVEFKAAIRARLDRLYAAFQSFKAEGLPVDAIAPEGALYLSVYIGLHGKPGLPDNEAVRQYVLDEAGCAILPFEVFGDSENIGWWRFSVGAVSVEDIDICMRRLGTALRKAVQ